jgi:hypothetical protein
MSTSFRGPALRGGTAVTLCLIALAAGCGQASGRVSGRVLLDGKPVQGGILTFVPANFKGQSVATKVEESGTYSVELPAGDMLISFDNRDLAPPPPRAPLPVPKGLRPDVAAKMVRPTPPAPPPDRAGRYVKVPDRYYSADTSDLKLTVKPGEQQFDVELSSKR